MLVIITVNAPRASVSSEGNVVPIDNGLEPIEAVPFLKDLSDLSGL